MCGTNGWETNYRNSALPTLVITVRQIKAYVLTSRTNTYICIRLFLSCFRKYKNAKDRKVYQQTARCFGKRPMNVFIKGVRETGQNLNISMCLLTTSAAWAHRAEGQHLTQVQTLKS
jgi:hypothetical protein